MIELYTDPAIFTGRAGISVLLLIVRKYLQMCAAVNRLPTLHYHLLLQRQTRHETYLIIFVVGVKLLHRF